MKSPVLFTLALVATVSLSCEKREAVSPIDLNKSCAAPPPPVRFVLLDKQGNALVPTTSTSLSISSAAAGERTQIPYVLGTLQGTSTPTKYGGVGIGCDIGSYSVRAALPIKEFALTWEGRAAGVLTYDLQRTDWARGCYREAAFLFNGKPVVVDATVTPAVALLPTEL